MKVVQMGPVEMALPLTSEETGGQFAVVVFKFPGPLPGGPGAHRHEKHDETLIALEGEFEVEIGSKVQRLGVGETLFVERGTRHGFKVVKGPAVLYTILTPGDFEGFFLEMADLDLTAPDYGKKERALWEKWTTFSA